MRDPIQCKPSDKPDDTSDDPGWPAVRHREALGLGFWCMYAFVCVLYVFVVELRVLESLDLWSQSASDAKARRDAVSSSEIGPIRSDSLEYVDLILFPTFDRLDLSVYSREECPHGKKVVKIS